MPITLATAPLTGFWIAMPGATLQVVGPQTRLHPAPTRVEYPNVALGEMVDTADGRVIVQASNRDPRRRSWIWSNYGPEIAVYERQQRWLQSLLARTRMAQGLPPFVYVYESPTGLLDVNRTITTTASSVSSNVITVPTLAGVHPGNLKNAVVEVLPATSGGSAFPYERRSVLSATTTTLTLENPLSGAPGSSQLLLTWSEPAWWRARILDTVRELRGDGGSVRYSASRFMFVIDEEMPV
jgi:hypothetical protein